MLSRASKSATAEINVASNKQVNTFEGNIYFAGDSTWQFQNQFLIQLTS